MVTHLSNFQIIFNLDTVSGTLSGTFERVRDGVTAARLVQKWQGYSLFFMKSLSLGMLLMFMIILKRYIVKTADELTCEHFISKGSSNFVILPKSGVVYESLIGKLYPQSKKRIRQKQKFYD